MCVCVCVHAYFVYHKMLDTYQKKKNHQVC